MRQIALEICMKDRITKEATHFSCTDQSAASEVTNHLIQEKESSETIQHNTHRLCAGQETGQMMSDRLVTT